MNKDRIQESAKGRYGDLRATAGPALGGAIPVAPGKKAKTEGKLQSSAVGEKDSMKR